MTKDNTNKIIKKILIRISKKYKKINPDKSFFEQNLDSIDFLKMIFLIEENYGIKINSKNFNKLQTITKLSSHINKIK